MKLTLIIESNTDSFDQFGDEVARIGEQVGDYIAMIKRSVRDFHEAEDGKQASFRFHFNDQPCTRSN